MNSKENIIISIEKKIKFLYGEKECLSIMRKIKELIYKYKDKIQILDNSFTEKDIFLIIYPDQITSKNEVKLKSLHKFLNKYLKKYISCVHVLPFYPYSSDDGFSVIDYYSVNKEFGSWIDIQNLSEDYRLMFDAVINHISSKSEWFKKFLSGDPIYEDYFIKLNPENRIKKELSNVFRPRSLPLLTEFKTKKGIVNLWTTFSDDQIDLNYKNSDILIEILKVLFFYITKGARLIRLDAVAYLWKKIGTTCIHLKETHTIIQLFRELFDYLFNNIIIVTETNVAHEDNTSYFGNGYNEAHMVYQFALPPLVLYSYLKEDASYLIEWAKKIKEPSNKTYFFNFLASHDGIGLTPIIEILEKKEIEYIIEKVKERGGFVSLKTNNDGTQIPYELNISYFDALSSPGEDEEIAIKKFINAQSILLSFVGVPGIYINSILGLRNYFEGVKETNRYRSINREKFIFKNIERDLKNKFSMKSKIYKGFCKLIEIRKKEKAFNPNSIQSVFNFKKSIFAYMRTSVDKQESILVLNNISSKNEIITLNQSLFKTQKRNLINVISKRNFIVIDKLFRIKIEPYEVLWLK